MGLLDDIRADLTEAMKAKDKLTVSTLRSVVAAVQEAEVAGSAATTLDDKQIQKVIAAHAKRRVEAAEAFEQGDRAEKAADERAELSVLEQYLPQQLPENALVEIVELVMAEGDYSTMADMGEAMKAVNGEVAGRAEGRVVADLVKSRLSCTQRGRSPWLGFFRHKTAQLSLRLGAIQTPVTTSPMSIYIGTSHRS